MDWGFLAALGDVRVFPAYGLLALVAWLVYTGRLVPSQAVVREIERLSEAHDKQLAGKDAEIVRAREDEAEWRAAWRESQDIAAEVRSQNRDLIDTLYFVRKVVASLPRGGDDEHGTND